MEKYKYSIYKNILLTMYLYILYEKYDHILDFLHYFLYQNYLDKLYM